MSEHSLLEVTSYLLVLRSEVLGFPGGSDGTKICLQCTRPRFDPWVGKTPGKGNGNPLQCSCLENFMDREEPVGLHS